MDDSVKICIEGRKNAIYSAYSITEQSIIEEIEDLFKRMYEFAENCTDTMDFENKFASSILNQEYIQLFTKIATTCTQKVIHGEERQVKSDGEYIADEIASEIRYQTRNATEPIRRKMRQEAYDTARNTPIVGDIMQAKQMADLFGKFKKKKKKNEDKEEK